MIDLRLLREDPDRVRAALARRGAGEDAGVLLELDAARRALVPQLDEARNRQKQLGKEVAQAPAEQREALLVASRQLAARIDGLTAQVREADAALDDVLARVPNIPDDSAPDGGEDDAVTLREVGSPRAFDFAARDFVELGDLLGAIDTVRAAKVSGARFGYLVGQGALLELALVRFGLDRVGPHGFVPVMPPVLVRRDALFGTGFLPTDEQAIFRTADDDLYLVGTSEVPLVSYHAGEILDPETLPRRYVGFSSCFRREAGSYGKDTRGIFRVHQFDKIEMVSFVLPERSRDEHDFLLAREEEILQALELPYRVVNIAVNDLGASAAKKYDCEAWFPSQGTYRELTSTSNCTDYQARRIACRTRGESGNRPLHTLNGTAIAVGRTILALLENHQLADGSVRVPAALQPYLGAEVLEPAQPTRAR